MKLLTVIAESGIIILKKLQRYLVKEGLPMRIEQGTHNTGGFGQLMRPGQEETSGRLPVDEAALGQAGGYEDPTVAMRSMARVLKTAEELPSAAELAKTILNTPEIILWTTLPSGKPPEGADSMANLQDTSEGRPAHRSNYGTAPGGTVPLGTDMLNGMLRLHGEHGYSFDVSTIAGGSHSKRSRHYAGVAFDISTVNGVQVAKDDGVHDRVMAALREMGATEVLGPGNAGHDYHIHVAWPRPAALDTGEADTDILGDDEYRNTTK